MAYVVMSGEAVHGFRDEELARQIRAIYDAGDGPIYFVRRDQDVEPRLAELDAAYAVLQREADE